jgi:hypothetical protein
VAPSADAWIDAAQPDVNHGSDDQLFVLGGASEQRALLSFTLPAMSGPDVLVGATLVLTLSQPPNLGSGSRLLSVYALSKALKEKQVTWLSYANGAMKMWATPGGDIGSSFGSGELRATDAALYLDVGELVALAYAAQQTELPLLVLDAEAATATPVSFAFESRKGTPAESPELDLEYCPP